MGGRSRTSPPLHNGCMPNIATVLKEEIARVARKEVRSEIASLKTAASKHRAEIAALKRRTHASEQELRRLSKANPKPRSTVVEDLAPQNLRFSAKGLASQRRRLGLSADDCGLLVGASGQSIYNWESGTARPRTSHLAAIAVLRTLGKKEAASRLEALKAARR